MRTPSSSRASKSGQTRKSKLAPSSPAASSGGHRDAARSLVAMASPASSMWTSRRISPPSWAPRMVKRAVSSGLPSAGMNVSDLETVPLPVARYYVRTTDAAGGVHIRLSPYDPRIVDIKFFDPNGLDISKNFERKIENLFFREDFRRVYLDDIGSICYAPAV